MRITLYTRLGCHLCENAKAAVLEARKQVEFNYEEVDIDGNPELRALYDEEVPVVAIDGVNSFRYGVDREELVKTIRKRMNTDKHG